MNHRHLPLIAGLVCLATSATAAEISWAVHNITGDPSDISTTGTIVSTAGGSRVGDGNASITGASVTVNGVQFFDNLTLDVVTHFDEISSRTGIPSSGASANYYTLLRYADRNSNSANQSITFTGLTIGNTYLVQVWMADNSNAAGVNALVLNDGTGASPNPGTSGHASLLHEVSEGGSGQYGIGTFTADATSQQIIVRRWTNLTTTPTASNQNLLNAWQLRDLGVSGPDETPPAPDPITWAAVPAAQGTGAITMTATTATDPSGVEYYFTETTGNPGGSDSGWQDSAAYTDTGLDPDTQYTYTVKARDKSAAQNETAPSSTASATTDPEVMAGPVNADNSTVEASTASVIANGIATSTITVTLRDANGLLVVGEGVALGGNPSGATINPASSQTTDANGQAAFTVSSSSIGPVVFTATSVTDSVTITQTANVDFTDPVLAQSFNVNFLDEGQANAANLLGVVGGPGETWNQGNMSLSNLVDTTGAIVSSVGVSGLGNDGRVIGGGAQGVFTGTRCFFNKGQDTTISITGLTPDTAYDIYLYALSHNTASWGDISNTERGAGAFVTTNTVLGNGQSQWLDNGRAGTNGTSFVPNGNYVVFQSIVTNGSGGISILVDAIGGDPVTNAGATRLHVCGLQIRPASGMSVDYMNWRNASYPALGLPDEDDDGDGLSNDSERIFGLDPTDPASARPIVMNVDPASGFFSYTRRKSSLVNMGFEVWVSTDLENWFVDNAANQLVESLANDIEVMGVDIDPALLSEPKLFVQVRATPLTGVDPQPSLVNVWGSGNTITVLFSEPMNPSSAGNPANYTVTQDGVGPLTITDASISSDGASVTLTLASPLGLDTGYTVGMERVTSGTGQALGSGVSRQFRTWDNDPTGIKVFILGGQSNMVGFGNVETGATGEGTIGSLRYLAVNNASYPDYDYTSLLSDPGQPATSPFRNRADVKVWWRDGGNGSLGGPISKGDLGPPYKGRDAGKIGPEFGFGQVIGDFYAENDVLIIKCAWGGHDLVGNFRPPSAVAKRGGQVGASFNATIEYTREVLHNLGTEFPEWSGRGYEIVGFGWHQGYNDRISTSASAEYKDNLADFISDVRSVFNKPEMPFVIATTGMAIGTPEAPPYTGYSAVEKAQLWVAGVPQPTKVLSADTRPFWRDPAESPATSGQGFHWNHNAETLFLIGKALGDDMQTLLGE
jgi:alpha-galactosidase